MIFPITIEEFKSYFRREAGLIYQEYPEFVRTAYMDGDVVYHEYPKVESPFWASTVDYNGEEPNPESKVWENIKEPPKPKALEDEPTIPEWVQPTAYNTNDRVIAFVNYRPVVYVSLQDNNYVTPGADSDFWRIDEDATNELQDTVLDADILRAMGEASFKFNENMFTEEKGKLIFLYLTMFFLVYDRQMAASGMNGNSAAGPVLSRTVGKMSVSYMESKLFNNYPSYEFLSTNDYGRKAFNLIMPYLRGNVQILKGGSTGE